MVIRGKLNNRTHFETRVKYTVRYENTENTYKNVLKI